MITTAPPLTMFYRNYLVLGRNQLPEFHTGVVQGTNNKNKVSRNAGTVSNDYIGTERIPGSGCGTSLRGIIIPMTSFYF